MTRTFSTGLSLATLCTLNCLAQANSAALKGRIVDETGAAVAGAVVIYNRGVSYKPRVPGSHAAPVLQPGEVHLNGSAVADAGGAFQATGLPAGRYGICIYHPATPYLDPCRWGTSISPQVLTPGAAVEAGRIVLQKGVFLRVQVDDPGHLLAVQPKPLRSDLTIGVVTQGGTFWPAGLIQTTATGRTYRVAVPVGRPLYCWVWSADYGLSVSGTAIAAKGSKLPFQASAGVDQLFTVSVTARLAGR
jgi:hypothetical protein